MGSYEGVVKIAAKRIGIGIQEYKDKLAAGLKHCGSCRLWKRRDKDFDIDKSRGDGRASRCIPCNRVAVRRSRSGAAPNKHAAQAAHDAVRWAIKRGTLTKPTALPCATCGKSAKEYHHHLGYAKAHQLDVQALCTSCHRRSHWD